MPATQRLHGGGAPPVMEVIKRKVFSLSELVYEFKQVFYAKEL